MALNGSGTFNRLYNWVVDQAAGVKISERLLQRKRHGEDDRLRQMFA